MEPEAVTTFALVWVMVAVCLALRTLLADRRLLKRFTVDFDAELQTVPEIVESKAGH
jgi:hypothetical protein